MIVESLDEYLETVSGYIFDDDKLVTYKWLSKELEIHVNIAKKILWEFWQKNKEEKNFDSTFLLMGILSDGGMRVEVVKEKDLSTAKEKFTKVVSEHIYSLQKVLPEIQVLRLAENGDIKYSAIKCIENNERSDKEMHTLRWGIASMEIQPQEKTKLPEPVKEKTEKSPEKKRSDAKKDNQKKGFNNLFGKVSNKQTSPSSSSNTEKKEADHKKQTSSKHTATESSKKGAQKGGLNSFLQQAKNQEKIVNAVPPETNKNNNSMDNKKTEKTVTVESSSKQKKSMRGKKRNRSKEANAVTKKRKRITIQSDSSDSESSSEEREEVMELSPSPEKVRSPVRVRSPSPPKIKHEGGKRKVLKQVDKTYEEDGFLVTKKVHVYESCSEDEVEVTEATKSVTPETHAETKAKKNTKQTTLMNFFKKS